MKKLILYLAKMFNVSLINTVYVDKIVEVKVLDTDYIDGNVTVNGNLTVKGILIVVGEVTAYSINKIKNL